MAIVHCSIILILPSWMDTSHYRGQFVLLLATLLFYNGLKILFTHFKATYMRCCDGDRGGCEYCRVDYLSFLFPYFEVFFFCVRKRGIVLRVIVSLSLVLAYSAVATLFIFHFVTAAINVASAVIESVPYVVVFWATVLYFMPWYFLLGPAALLITIIIIAARQLYGSDLPLA